MCSNFQFRDFGLCTVCGGRFGLVRYYAWQRAICSKKCAGRLRDRRENDHKWLALAAPIASTTELSRRPDFESIPRYVLS